MTRSSKARPSGGGAHVVVDLARRGPAVSRRLFGQFTEHLGNNVYLGAWAQLAPNPEFAPASRWLERPALNERLGRYGEAAEMPGLADWPARGFAPFWMPSGAVTGELLVEDGRDIQRLTAAEDGGRLETAVFLPLRRVRAFELSVRCRGRAPGGLTAELTDRAGAVLSSARLPLGGRWATRVARMAVPAGASFAPGEPHRLRLCLAGGRADLRRVLLNPVDHLDGWDVEIVEAMRRARVPLLRFPGGNFVSGYHWADGVGPLDARPTLPNPAWPDVVEFNHVGTDEWLRLCELVGAEALICVNGGNGTAAEAREWVEYCNAPPDSPPGARRAANGRREPWGVKLWEVGNELYGKWQIGCVDAEGYARRYLEFLGEMSKADSDLHFIANGHDAAWNRALVAGAGAAVTSISAHPLMGWNFPADADPREAYDDLMAFSAHFEGHIADLARPMVEAGLVPRLAVTELQIMCRPHGLPKNHTLTEAAWTAGILNACIKSGGLVELVTHSALVNHGGGLRKERGVVYANPVWQAMQLYADQPCLIPARTRVECPTFDSPGKWLAPARTSPTVDAAALVDESGKTANVFVVNRSRTSAVSVEIDLAGFEAASAEAATLAGDFLDANTWREPERVRPRTETLDVRPDGLTLTLEPCSLTRITFQAK